MISGPNANRSAYTYQTIVRLAVYEDIYHFQH